MKVGCFNIMKSLKSLFFAVSIMGVFCLLIFFRKEISQGVLDGVNYSFSVLIPSLFPIMLISCMVCNSSFTGTVSKFFSPLINKVFRLSSYCTLPIIFGLVSGYPVGAKLTNNLYKTGKISENEAKRLLLFCVNPGVSFCVIYVGGVIFSSISLGVKMFFSTVISSIIVAFITRIGEKTPPKNSLKTEKIGFVKCMQLSSEQSLKASVNMCLYVVIFSAFIPLLDELFSLLSLENILQLNLIYLEQELTLIIKFLLDVVTGVSVGQGVLSSEIFVFALSFGGVCVHMQVFSIFKSNFINYKKFYAYKIISAIIAVCVFRILCTFSHNEMEVFSTVNKITSTPTNTTVMGSACLIILAFSFLLMRKKDEEN